MGMMAERASRARELLLPWTGLLGAGLGWFLSQQIGSEQSFDNCRDSGALVIGLIGLIALTMTGAGAWLALPIWRERVHAHGARPFIAGAGLGLAALFAVAIILQTAASLIIPRCYG